MQTDKRRARALLVRFIRYFISSSNAVSAFSICGAKRS